MRWIVTSLVVINILVFIGQLLMPDEEAGSFRTPPAARAAGGASLQLLGELGPTARASILENRQRRQQLVSTALIEESEPPLCTLIGPFDELLHAEYLIERAAALDVLASITHIEVPGEVNYWVYLPPRNTRKQAFNELRALQAKGIDSYVIPKGELANGISFGMFSQPDLARNRLDDMRSRGYAAELKEIRRSYKQIWVVIQPGQISRLGPESWQKILAEEEGVERRQNFCPDVASE